MEEFIQVMHPWQGSYGEKNQVESVVVTVGNLKNVARHEFTVFDTRSMRDISCLI
jgi:hypothetical protein